MGAPYGNRVSPELSDWNSSGLRLWRQGCVPASLTGVILSEDAPKWRASESKDLLLTFTLPASGVLKDLLTITEAPIRVCYYLASQSFRFRSHLP